MSKTLDEILNQYASDIYAPEEPAGVTKEAKQQIKSLMLEIIGNEVEPNSVEGLLRDVQLRNNALIKRLRKEIEQL